MNKTIIRSYYFILVALVLGMVAQTVLTGSHYVATGRRVAELEKQKRVLVEQQHTLEKLTSQETSMLAISRFAESQGYAPITQLAAVHYHTQNVALR